MNHDRIPAPSLLVGKGHAAQAAYREPELPSYRGNPLIEALPPILTEEEATLRLARYPQHRAEERQALPHVRCHWIQNGLKFFAPLPLHLDLERRFSCLIRAGYESRNPLHRTFWQDMSTKVRDLNPEGSSPSHVWSTAAGFNIIGMSGVGKSTSVQSILLLYPQVIYHSHYRGRDFTHGQLVWLKLDCPFDGSIKGLCLAFLQAVDDILNTHYCKNYAGRRSTVDELLMHMARIASIHCLGVLVIDEIQHLSHVKSGGSEKMLNFFVTLVNTVGVPVVLVGTYKAMSVLSSEFRQIRRGTGQGDLVWDRMAEDATWHLFVESLWRYQYTQTPCPLTSALSHVLYDQTQGITDFAVKIYMLAQIRAIASGLEVVNESVIRSVARDSLRLAAPVLEALRRRDYQVLRRYEDVHPMDFGTFLYEARARLEVREITPPLPPNPNDISQAISLAAVSEPPAALSTNTSPTEPAKADDPIEIPPTKAARKRIKTASQKRKLTLLAASDKAKAGWTHYDALQQAGYIRPADEYLPEETRT